MDQKGLKLAASPAGTPLYALSPERLNGIRSPQTGSPNGRENYSRGSLPASPAEMKLGSPPRMSPTRNSDVHVQGMVARFNHLDIRDPKRDDAALKRMEMAREMAENDARKTKEQKEEVERQAYKVREEARKMRKEMEESRDREKKVSKRLEGVMVRILEVVLWKAIARLTIIRRSYTAQRKPTAMPKAYTRKKFERPAKRLSNPHPHWSNFKKSSRAPATRSASHKLASNRKRQKQRSEKRRPLMRSTSLSVFKKSYKRCASNSRCSKRSAMHSRQVSRRKRLPGSLRRA